MTNHREKPPEQPPTSEGKEHQIKQESLIKHVEARKIGTVSLKKEQESFLKGEEAKRKRQAHLTYGILYLFAFAVIATFGIFYLVALSKAHLDNIILQWLGGAVIAEIATLLTLIIKGTF